MTDSLMLKTLNGEQTERPPIWFMRQAGRVLPSYMAMRDKYNFKTMMDTPELAAEVTLLPYHDLGIDALILFSDILVIPEALGMELAFTDKGPRFPKPISEDPTFELVEREDKLQHIYQAIDLIMEQKPADIPLFGFCGAPFTVFCYMVQGISTRHTFPDAVKMLYQDPKFSHAILEKITQLSIKYAVEQVKHGISAFQLFESHANLIPGELYQATIMPYVKRILAAVREAGCKAIYFPKGFSLELATVTPEMTDFVSIDWQITMDQARKLVPQGVGLQGNIDPRLLLADQATIRKELEKLIPFGSKNQDWIFNLGHGLIPQIHVDNVKFAIDWVKEANWLR
jgi:uroporphyrinogen decarboxylase